MEQAAEEKNLARPKLGEPLRRALASRGIDVSLEDAARVARALLSLADQGLLEPVEKPEVKVAEGASSDSSLDQELEPGT
jgi:hypothetical protein